MHNTRIARQMAQAQAPRPEFISFRTLAELGPNVHAGVMEVAKTLSAMGAGHIRAVQTPEGFWLEGWRQRPAVEPPFDPPIVLEPVK